MFMTYPDLAGIGLTPGENYAIQTDGAAGFQQGKRGLAVRHLWPRRIGCGRGVTQPNNESAPSSDNDFSTKTVRSFMTIIVEEDHHFFRHGSDRTTILE